VKRIERDNGKVWVGFFHLWVTNPTGDRLRRKKEKVLGPAAMPKHEALKKLATYIQAFTRIEPAQATVIRTYADLWRTFSGLKSGQWSQPFRETIRSVFATHVLPVIGKQRLDEIGLATLQLLVNQMAEDGYSKSAVRKVRVYVKASFDYAADEDLVAKNPARKLAMPKIRKTVCSFVRIWRSAGTLRPFSLVHAISVGVDRMQRNFEPMRKQVEAWRQAELTDVSAKMIIYEAFIESELEVPKPLARRVHEYYFDPKYDEFRRRTIVEPLERFHIRVQGTRTGAAVRSNRQARPVS
jgi:hypothetical protein